MTRGRNRMSRSHDRDKYRWYDLLQCTREIKVEVRPQIPLVCDSSGKGFRAYCSHGTSRNMPQPSSNRFRVKSFNDP